MGRVWLGLATLSLWSSSMFSGAWGHEKREETISSSSVGSIPSPASSSFIAITNNDGLPLATYAKSSLDVASRVTRSADNVSVPAVTPDTSQSNSNTPKASEVASSYVGPTSPTVVSTPSGVVSIPHSEEFQGVDGHWSTFIFEIGEGSQKQSVRLLPATSICETFVIDPSGCHFAGNVSYTGGFNACEKQRGGIFYKNQSLTWFPSRAYSLKDVAVMNRYGFSNLSALFGYETVTPGFANSGGIPVKGSVVAVWSQIHFSWLGLFGIDPRPTNYTDNGGMNSPQLSFMQRLKLQKAIGSLSYGYTAGAFWRGSGAFGSLTLGGYDAKRRVGAGLSFPFFGDDETPLKVNLTSVQISSDHGFNDIGIKPVLIRIDSTRPWIYLPQRGAMGIISALGLITDQVELADPNKDIFYVNDSRHASMIQDRVSVDFKLSAIADSGFTGSDVTISLPYEALVQTLSYPLGNNRRYIPIRIANDTEQYVLGRTFLQEAYITVNHETRKFSVHQAAFPYGNQGELIPMSSTDDRKLSKAVIGGIAAGVATLVALFSIALIFLRRARLRKRREAALAEEAARAKDAELDLQSPTSLDSPSDATMKAMELDSDTVHEINGYPHVQPQEIGDSTSLVHGEMPDESTLSSYGGYFKEVPSPENGMPIIKVYYEMDGTPPGSEQNTPTGTLSSAGTTLVGSSYWSATGTGTGNGLSPPNHHNPNTEALSPIPQTPARFYERGDISNERLGIGDMSPIPQTPLEFYGTAALPGGPGRRGWIGRAPGPDLPRVVLTPATPGEMTVEERERIRWLRGHSGRGRGRGRGSLRKGESGGG